MPYYFFAFSIYSMALAALLQKKVHHRLTIFALGLLPIFFLVICRGNVGTDTAAYLQIVSDIQESGSSDLELGFVLLIKAMLLLGMGPKLILATIACFATGLVVYAATFSRRSLLLAAFCIVPIFYLDMTMNGLRYGLAFTAMMCAVALFYQKRWRLCIVFATCAVLVHLSGWLILAMMAMFADDKDEFKQWAIITVVLGSLILVLQNMDGIMALFGEQWSGVSLKDKASAYMSFPSPSLLSGLAPLTLSLITLGLIKLTDTAAYAIRTRRFYLLLLGIVTAFLFAKF
jgi:heme/copper-type cytochrome/quinol oxidase subunit 3